MYVCMFVGIQFADNSDRNFKSIDLTFGRELRLNISRYQLILVDFQLCSTVEVMEKNIVNSLVQLEFRLHI